MPDAPKWLVGDHPGIRCVGGPAHDERLHADEPLVYAHTGAYVLTVNPDETVVYVWRPKADLAETVERIVTEASQAARAAYEAEQDQFVDRVLAALYPGLFPRRGRSAA